MPAISRHRICLYAYMWRVAVKIRLSHGAVSRAAAAVLAPPATATPRGPGWRLGQRTLLSTASVLVRSPSLAIIAGMAWGGALENWWSAATIYFAPAVPSTLCTLSACAVGPAAWEAGSLAQVGWPALASWSPTWMTMQRAPYKALSRCLARWPASRLPTPSHPGRSCCSCQSSAAATAVGRRASCAVHQAQPPLLGNATGVPGGSGPSACKARSFA